MIERARLRPGSIWKDKLNNRRVTFIGISIFRSAKQSDVDGVEVAVIRLSDQTHEVIPLIEFQEGLYEGVKYNVPWSGFSKT